MLKKLLERINGKFSTSFDIASTPVEEYFINRKILLHNYNNSNLSPKIIESINIILAKWAKNWESHKAISKSILEIDSITITKETSSLISINELWVAYWYVNYIPAKEMQKQGYLIGKKWSTSKDSKVRCECQKNSDVWIIDIDSPFPWTGDFFAPSSKILNCRCTSTYQIIW